MASNILESIIFPNTEFPLFEEVFEEEDVNNLVFPNDDIVYTFKMEDLSESSVIDSSTHVVRRYLHIPSGNFMAVKQIHIPFNRYLDETKEKRLRKLNLEIHTHREISNSPYIVDFYGLCLHEGCALLCMELMDVSLHGLVTTCHKSGKNISEDLLGYTAVSILEALKVCKSKGIIHRDIKPENILIKKSGEIKLADFGESRFVGESQKVTTIGAGTIRYWPPERLYTERTKYDIRSDIWSFGLTLVEMAYGKYPIVHADGSDIDFQTVGFITLQNRILEANADEIINRCVKSKYSEDLCEFIRPCLQKLEDRANVEELTETELYERFQARNTKRVAKLILQELDEYDFTNDPNHYYDMPRISPTARIKPQAYSIPELQWPTKRVRSQSLWARIVEFISAKKCYFIFWLIILLVSVIIVVVVLVTKKPTNQDGGTTTINNNYSTTHPFSTTYPYSTTHPLKISSTLSSSTISSSINTTTTTNYVSSTPSSSIQSSTTAPITTITPTIYHTTITPTTPNVCALTNCNADFCGNPYNGTCTPSEGAPLCQCIGNLNPNQTCQQAGCGSGTTYMKLQDGSAPFWSPNYNSCLSDSDMTNQPSYAKNIDCTWTLNLTDQNLKININPTNLNAAPYFPGGKFSITTPQRNWPYIIYPTTDPCTLQTLLYVAVNKESPTWVTIRFQSTDNVPATGAYFDWTITSVSSETPTPPVSTCQAETTSQITPTSTDNPLSDEIGTACANDPSNLWLDIVVAIDNTTGMGAGVNNIAAMLTTIFSYLNIAQNGTHHYTRVGIVIFDSNATIYANLTAYSSNDELYDGLIPLLSSPPGTVEKIDIANALITASNMFSDNQRNARKVILLFASSYSPNGFEISSTLQEIGYFIIGVDYDADGLKSDSLKNITSPGMFFYASDGEDPSRKKTIYNELLDGFSYANCICPSNTQQFRTVNSTSGYGHYYADCLVSTKGGTYAQIAELTCKNQYHGVLVTVTSQEKKAFLINNVVPSLNGNPSFHIGMHNLNGIRNWYGYGGTNIPLGSFQDWAPGFNASSQGDCVFYDQYDGKNWSWETGQCMGVNPFPYICQFHACDADNYCDLI